MSAFLRKGISFAHAIFDFTRSINFYKQDKKTWSLALAALGVVYGDIGTSPLYTIKECFHGKHAISLSEANILGVLSLIFWSLLVIICIKYVLFIIKADNRGEGGIFALLGLILKGNGQTAPHLRNSVILI